MTRGTEDIGRVKRVNVAVLAWIGAWGAKFGVDGVVFGRTLIDTGTNASL